MNVAIWILFLLGSAIFLIASALGLYTTLNQ